ncbi:hypothetical protein TNCV_4475271 [Trichonephila clavipes]|nr:hypothetical protein TNCV_4475271 [Trichonephila clavipes]
MALSDSLPQINLGFQGGTQGGSNTLLKKISINNSYSVSETSILSPMMYCLIQGGLEFMVQTLRVGTGHFVTGLSSRFLFNSPLGFPRGRNGNYFQPTREEERV